MAKKQKKFCCDTMRKNIEHRCEVHKDPMDCPDKLIHQMKSGEYGIRIHDGGSSISVIKFCPWCGAPLSYESYRPVHQRLADRIREVDGVFAAFLGDGTALHVHLIRRLSHIHAEARRQVLELVNELAPGTPVKFVVSDQEFPTGALA